MKTTTQAEERDQRPEAREKQTAEAETRGQAVAGPDRMAGGELEASERAAYLRLRGLILSELDVHAVLGLSWVPEEGRWLYCIQTPLATWPKFVVGWTDGENEEPKVMFRCGLKGAAIECFNEHNFGDHQ